VPFSEQFATFRKIAAPSSYIVSSRPRETELLFSHCFTLKKKAAGSLETPGKTCPKPQPERQLEVSLYYTHLVTPSERQQVVTSSQSFVSPLLLIP
jgi:hypothetical protein